MKERFKEQHVCTLCDQPFTGLVFGPLREVWCMRCHFRAGDVLTEMRKVAYEVAEDYQLVRSPALLIEEAEYLVAHYQAQAERELTLQQRCCPQHICDDCKGEISHTARFATQAQRALDLVLEVWDAFRRSLEREALYG